LYDETAIARRTIMLYAAANALVSAAAALSAVWSGASLMATIAWVLSAIIHISIAMFTSIALRRPAPVPVMAISRAMHQEVRPGAYSRNWH